MPYAIATYEKGVYIEREFEKSVSAVCGPFEGEKQANDLADMLNLREQLFPEKAAEPVTSLRCLETTGVKTSVRR